jgi:nucleotide-binding universal stress UspA family protein
MFKRILIATDGSELAGHAVAQGMALAKVLSAQVTVATVTEPWDALSIAALADRNVPNPVGSYEECAAAAANRILWSAKETAKQQDQMCRTLHIKDRYPAEGILEAAKAEGCDLIVIASHGRRGVAKLLLGSQASKVVTLSPVPVLVFRR